MKVWLCEGDFGEKERLLAESGEFKAVAFRYSTGVAALKASKETGDGGVAMILDHFRRVLK